MTTTLLIQIVGFSLMGALGLLLWYVKKRKKQAAAAARQQNRSIPVLPDPEMPIPEVPVVAAPAAYASAAVPVSPMEPRIFSGWDRLRKLKEERLPRVEPADIPNVATTDYAFGPLTPVFAALLPESEERRQAVKIELRNAGYYQPHAMDNIRAIRYVAIMLPLLLLGVLMLVVPQRLELGLIGTMLMVAMLGWAMPRLIVRGKATERRSEIERSLPDMLDMLNMCVSQGMTVLTALRRVNQELRSVYPVLSQELQIVAEQARIGTLEHALQNFNERVDVPDVHSFTTLLIQTERMGTSVTVALGEYAKNMRESLRQRADEKANQATFKLLFPTVLCLMPAVYMFLLGPAIIELSDFFNGGNRPINNATQALRRYNR